jgi:hypothetical protein
MVNTRAPAKQVTVLVVVGIVGLLVALFVGVTDAFGLVGVAVSLGLVAVLVLVAAATGASLQAIFRLFAYAVGVVRTVVVTAKRYLGR